jgi:hypothetical protein
MNKAAKITLIVIGSLFLGFVLLIGTCVGGIVMLTRGPVDAADKLVQLCGAHKLHDAYQLTAPQFRAKVDEAAFIAEIKAIGLDRATASSWTSRNIENSSGRVAGTVHLVDGKDAPLVVESAKEDGRWLIVGVHPPGDDK